MRTDVSSQVGKFPAGRCPRGRDSQPLSLDRLVGHESLLHGEEIIDLLDPRLSDDRPVWLARNIGQHAKRFLPRFFQDRRDTPELLNHLANLPGFAVEDLTDYVHDLTPFTRRSPVELHVLRGSHDAAEILV